MSDKFTLSVELGVGFERTNLSYDIPAIFDVADFVSIKAFNLRGKEDEKTGIHTAIYDGVIHSVHYCVTNLTKLDVPKAKLNLGIAMHGNKFKLTDPSKTNIGAPATFAGSMKYNEICKKIKDGSLKNVYDITSKATYAYGGSDWIGYEDLKSLKEKANYISNYALGGAMIQTIDADDYSNGCGGGNSDIPFHNLFL